MMEGRAFPWPGLFEAIPGKTPVQQRVEKGLVLNAKAQSHLEQKMTVSVEKRLQSQSSKPQTRLKLLLCGCACVVLISKEAGHRATTSVLQPTTFLFHLQERRGS